MLLHCRHISPCQTITVGTTQIWPELTARFVVILIVPRRNLCRLDGVRQTTQEPMKSEIKYGINRFHELTGSIFVNEDYNDLIMSTMGSQITSLTIVNSTFYSGADEKTSKLRVTGLCEGKVPVTDEFSAQRASKAENAFIWWRHVLHNVILHKNIASHTAHINFLWPELQQWLMVHTSDLMRKISR